MNMQQKKALRVDSLFPTGRESGSKNKNYITYDDITETTKTIVLTVIIVVMVIVFFKVVKTKKDVRRFTIASYITVTSYITPSPLALHSRWAARNR